MKVTFENPDKINGLMTITVEEADYKGEVEKTLKNYRKRANIPGFRPGQVPMGMIKRQFGTKVKVDEINRLLGDKLTTYIRENNIQMLGEPLSSEKQEPQDLSQDEIVKLKLFMVFVVKCYLFLRQLQLIFIKIKRLIILFKLLDLM